MKQPQMLSTGEILRLQVKTLRSSHKCWGRSDQSQLWFITDATRTKGMHLYSLLFIIYSLIPQYIDVDKSVLYKGGFCFFLVLQWEYSGLQSPVTTGSASAIQHAIDFAVSNRLSSALLRGRTMFKEQCSAWVLPAALIFSISSGSR